MIARVILSSRAADRYFGVLTGCAAISLLLGPFGLKIQWSPQHSAIVLGVPDLCAVLLICVGVIQLRPRMWIVDRLGVPGRRWIPAICSALVIIGGPQLTLALGSPHRESWGASATNSLFLAGLAVLLAPLISAPRSGGLVILLYFGLSIGSQLTPVIGSFSPLVAITWPTAGPTAVGKVLIAFITVGASLIFAVTTLGLTARVWSKNTGAGSGSD